MIFDFIRKRLDPMWKNEKAMIKRVKDDKKLDKLIERWKKE